MSEIIRISGKIMAEIPVEKLNGVLVSGELATQDANFSIPVVIKDKSTGEYKGIKTPVTISGGVHGGLFFVANDYDGYYHHEEYFSVDDFPYQVYTEVSNDAPAYLKKFWSSDN